MASFQLFWPVLLNDEGYYSKKVGDSGGETWEGIARNDWPNWNGWPIIDWYKNKPNFPKSLRVDPNLLSLVQSFYINNFWNKMMGDKINNQSIANMIGDWGVNAGLCVPIKRVQQILGVSVDGIMGPDTLGAINNADQENLFNSLKQSRIAFYNDVVADHPNDKQFLDDWIERTNSIMFS